MKPRTRNKLFDETSPHKFTLSEVSLRNLSSSHIGYSGRLVALDGFKRPLLVNRSTVIGDRPKISAASVLENERRLMFCLDNLYMPED